MSQITIDQIKKLRDETGAGVSDVKRALEDASGDEKKAKEILRDAGFEKAAKKETRKTNAGVVSSYVHATGTQGATVVLLVETDFVARHADFKKLAYELAMQICAMNPKDVGELIDQPYIRDESKTVGDLIKEHIAKFGENIQIKEFRRFEV